MKLGYLLLGATILISTNRSVRSADSSSHEPPLEPSQTWVIDYPNSKSYDGKPYVGPLHFRLGWSEKSQGLRLDIGWLPEKRRDEDVTLLLHLPNQEAIRPSWADLNPQGRAGSFEGSPLGAIASFPWSSNVMEIGWIEVTVLTHHFWLKVPSGFTRNPFEQTLPSSSKYILGVPGWVRHLGKNDEILDWRSVKYEFPIQNGWRLLMTQTNGSNCNLTLYRDGTKNGRYLWDARSPVTSLKISYPGKKAQDCHCANISIPGDEGGYYRNDVYDVPLGRDLDRCWETVEIGVEDKSYTLTVPSSLYQRK
jgi:hypothetical protein